MGRLWNWGAFAFIMWPGLMQLIAPMPGLAPDQLWPHLQEEGIALGGAALIAVLLTPALKMMGAAQDITSGWWNWERFGLQLAIPLFAVIVNVSIQDGDALLDALWALVPSAATAAIITVIFGAFYKGGE